MPISRNRPVTSLDAHELLSRNARHSPCFVLRFIQHIAAKPYKCLAALILFCLFSAVPAIAGTDYWAPWVTDLKTNSATINWRGADDGLDSVEYATSSYYEEHKSFQKEIESKTAGAYQHILIAGLEPDTAYIYKVKPSDNPDAFSNRTFRTMPVSGPFTFIVISDTHAQEQRFKYVADAIAANETDPLFILDGGDYAGHDQEAEWTDYFQFADGMLAKFPIFHTIGNHEYHNHGNPAGPPTDAAQYHWTFDVPTNGALNYSFDCSGIRFVVLNSPAPNNANGDDPHTSLALAKSQAPWLEEQLDNTMAGTFTIHHHPIWDYGRTTINSNLQPWETLYHAYNVSANFAGHTHNYQRYSVKGIPYFVVGNAGGAFADIAEGDPRSIWYQYGETRQLGYLKVTVDPVNNTATAQEIFVAFVLTDTDVTATVYDPPIIADTVTFPLSTTLSTLTVTKAGLGTGTVSSSPACIFCGPASSTCSANFKKVETVVLTATPDTGSVFTGWTGAGRGQGKCTVTMRPGEDITVGAVFEKSSGKVPGKPTDVKAVRGNGQATVFFTAPGNGGTPITSYTVTSDPEGITVRRAGSGSSPITVTGLSYNISYTFTVTAANANGSGAPSDPSAPVTPTAAVPGAPAAVTAARNGNQSLNFSFTAPSANGAEITGYTVTSRPGGITAKGTASPITVTGLENGTSYSFRVTATNGIGTGPASAWSPYVTPAIAPGAPTSVTATLGILQTTIAFKAPASNGGMPITSYTLTYVTPASSITITKASSPITVTGLSNIEYTFNLRANNMIGAGASSSVSVTPAATKPGAPTGVNASTSADTAGGKAFVSFTPLESDGGTAILGYTVTSRPGGITATGTASPITVTGLTNGTSYSFNVAAVNKVGTGPASAWSNPVTPATAPFAPKIGTAIKGNGQATVYFTAPSAVGGVPGNGGSTITSYTVTSDPEGITVTRAGTSSSPITVTGLTENTPYTFTVTAANLIGKSAPSSASNTVIPSVAVPGSPTAVTATPGNGQATVSFTAPMANGTPIQFYTMFIYPGAIPVTGFTSSPITATGLKNGTAYTFKVTATNDVGTGPAASTAAVTPSTVPGKPTKVQAVRGNGQATVSFAAPVSVDGVPGNGFSPITSYTVSLDGVISITKATSPITVTGLENGTEYTFVVWANNKNGKGAVTTSNVVTPATLPGAPAIDGTENGNTQVAVLFTAPTIDGGSPITKYTVISNPGGKTATAASSPITVTRLTNGTAYTFTVKATNDVGTGPASAPSGKAIPGASGWAIGNDTNGTAVILHTANGGDQWTVQGNNSLWLNHSGNDISAVDEHTAWAALASAGTEGGIILHTTDGGSSWNSQTLPIQVKNGGVKGIKGVSRTEAWAVGIEGPLLHTINGGLTWTTVPTGDVVFKQVNRIDVLGDDIWIADRGNGNTGIIHSPDKGKTWRQEYLPDVASGHGPLAITIANSSAAWASVNYQGDIYRTTDGGLNWDLAAPNVSGANDIDDLCAIGTNTVWGIQNIDGTEGYVMRVTATGSGVVKDAWSFTDYVYEGVTAFDENNAWVGGFRAVGAPTSLPSGSILHTSNGKDWTSQTLPVNDVRIWKLSFVGAKR